MNGKSIDHFLWNSNGAKVNMLLLTLDMRLRVWPERVLLKRKLNSHTSISRWGQPEQQSFLSNTVCEKDRCRYVKGKCSNAFTPKSRGSLFCVKCFCVSCTLIEFCTHGPFQVGWCMLVYPRRPALAMQYIYICDQFFQVSKDRHGLSGQGKTTVINHQKQHHPPMKPTWSSSSLMILAQVFLVSKEKQICQLVLSMLTDLKMWWCP